MPRTKKVETQQAIDLSTPGPMWKAKTKLGYNLDVVVSALQKAIRRGRTNEALFWGHELWNPIMKSAKSKFSVIPKGMMIARYMTEAIGDRISADRFRCHSNQSSAERWADVEIRRSPATEVVIYLIRSSGKLKELETRTEDSHVR
jgi:hypothetical protein